MCRAYARMIPDDDGLDIWSKTKHYVMDYSQPAGSKASKCRIHLTSTLCTLTRSGSFHPHILASIAFSSFEPIPGAFGLRFSANALEGPKAISYESG